MDRLDLNQRPSGYELDGQTLSPSDLIALIALRPPKNHQTGRVLDPSWTLGFQAPFGLENRRLWALSCSASETSRVRDHGEQAFGC